jgi:hypothetical protein
VTFTGPRPIRGQAAARSVTLEIPLAGLAPAQYLLYINAEDGRTKARAHAQASLVIAVD